MSNDLVVDCSTELPLFDVVDSVVMTVLDEPASSSYRLFVMAFFGLHPPACLPDGTPPSIDLSVFLRRQ